MITIERTGRSGVLTGIIVNCDTEEQALQLAQLSTYWRADGRKVLGHGAKKDVAKIKSVIDRMNMLSAKTENTSASKPATERVLVPAGKYKIGDMLHGYKITGLGREFTPNSDQYSANGIDPWIDTVCYAYFN
jgi:hypothetical protein